MEHISAKVPVEEFISWLEKKNIKIWADGGNLRYKAPKGIVTNEILKCISERKSEILSYLDSDGFGQMFYLPIPRTEDRGYYPLSPAQKRMFLLNRIDSRSTAYNMTQVLSIKGRVDTLRLRSVIGALADRHEALRTSFEMIDGEPAQKVHPEVDFEIEYIEIDNDRKEIDSIIDGFIKPYDLSRLPLFRFALIRLKGPESACLLLQDMHHIVADGVSEAILVREVNELYTGKSLPGLKIQYRDYAAWQHNLLEGEGVKKQRSFWKEKLSGELPMLNLPLDFPRPPEFTYKGDSVKIHIDQMLADRLYATARQCRVTLYTLLLSAYSTLLYKYTGQHDIIVGTPTAGRRHADVDGIIGVFINTLAIRCFPDGHKSFSEFLRETGEGVVEAFDNQDYQFEQLVDELSIKRDLSRNPVFDTLFVLQNIDIDEIKAEGLKISDYNYVKKVAQFDLEVVATGNKGCICLEINYCSDLFKRDSILRLGRHFKNILEAVPADPGVKISEIDMLDSNEKEELLQSSSGCCSQIPEKAIHEIFEEQAAKTPENIALISGQFTLTYRQLNEKSNRLASVLREKGVGPDSIVAIMARRSAEMLIGIMGILKAGGAYLPLDMEYPRDRSAYILNDCGAGILLTAGRQENVPDFTGEIIDLTDSEVYRGCGLNLPRVGTERNLAYVIYTSGSSGNPKGVMIEHRSAVNILIALQRDYPLMEEDTYLLKTAYTFDVSVAELFGWFLAGGRLAVLEQGDEKDPERILQAIKDYGVTHINFVPSMLNIFLDVLSRRMPGSLYRLRYVFAAGEALAAETVDNFRRTAEGVRLENIYGPTESTVYATRYSVSGFKNDGCIPIGKPFDNITAYILDGEGHLQPVGIPGELCLGGHGVARGYVNMPGLTESRFAPSPSGYGERIYRTGDVARWLKDGNIEYLGRMDNQVKVRGFRIELGEIEAQLLKHPGIKEAVVSAREDEPGAGKCLCAYLVEDEELTVHELRSILKGALPDYMIPSHFMRMERLPLTANGKVDRNALPQPGKDINTGQEYVEPVSGVQQRLAAVWREILGVERVGINDSFFDLGGNSLKAIQMIGRLEGLSINMRQVMQYPTIAGLEKYVVRLEDKEEDFPEPMRENLDMEYHFLKNGEIDEYGLYLNCSLLMVYLISKKRLKDIRTIREAFLGDIVFKVVQNPDGSIYDIDCLPYPFREDIFKVQYYKGMGYTPSVTEIENLLDSGELVIVNTCMEKVPFSKHFKGFNFTVHEVRDEHTFLIVAYDKKSFYYVDIPYVINSQNYIQYNRNKSVGIIDKKEMQPAFDTLLNYATVFVDTAGIQAGTSLKKLINLTLDNYLKGTFYKGGKKVSQGISAVQCLLEICLEENLSLDDSKAFTTARLIDLFNWKLWMIASQRKLLRYSLEDYEEECDQKIRFCLIEKLEELYTMWKDFGYCIGERHGKGHTVFDSFYKNHLKELREKEEELISALKRLWPEESS